MSDEQDICAPWIVVDRLCFFHGPHEVLRNISLQLLAGRHYVVAGPNGAGKSTLLDCVAGLRKTAAGSVLVRGLTPEQYGAAEFARILSLVPQEAGFDFSFAVREVVAMGRRPYLNRWGRLDRKDLFIVEEALAAMDLQPLADKSVTALSGGERRRCVVARTLAQHTPIVLLDEPTAGLDIDRALSVMAHAKRLAESGALVLTVSHDLNLAARFAHELIFLKNGRLIAHGPVDVTFKDMVLAQIYEAEAQVGWDAFGGAPVVSFRELGGGGEYSRREAEIDRSG